MPHAGDVVGNQIVRKYRRGLCRGAYGLQRADSLKAGAQYTRRAPYRVLATLREQRAERSIHQAE